MSTPPAIYPTIAMMGISVISGAVVFWLLPRRWVDDGSRTKRWAFRGLLFLAAFLLACSLDMFCVDLLLKVKLVDDALASLPLLVRQAFVVVPLVAIWLLLYRGLLNDYRSDRSK